jgi:hypothetical protein
MLGVLHCRQHNSTKGFVERALHVATTSGACNPYLDGDEGESGDGEGAGGGALGRVRRGAEAKEQHLPHRVVGRAAGESRESERRERG